MAEAPDNQALLITAEEAAERMRISPKTLWSMTVPRGSIPVIRLGRSVRYSPVAIEKWIAMQLEYGEAADK